MFKKLIILFQIFFSIASSAQKIISSEFYNEGVEYFNKNNYKTADSLYTESLEFFPNIDSYYNLALTKLKLGDTCSLCHNLKKASLLGDTISTKYYNKFCSDRTEKMMNFYKTSESVYSAIVKTKPNSNAYFDLALTKAKLGNKCAFCQYLDSASKNKEVDKMWSLFKKVCCTSETVQIIDSAQKDFKIINIISLSSCTNERKECSFLKINQKNDTILNYSAPVVPKGYIVRVDTLKTVGEYQNIFYIDTISANSNQINCNSKNIYNKIIIHEILPSFKGGEEQLYQWLGNNIKYPQNAKESNIMGIVILTFVIEEDGSITGIKILKDIGGGCGQEAVRVVKAMPKWIPGTQEGKPVRVQFNLPIKFTLE